VFCPHCGEGDSLENVLAEVEQYAQEHLMQSVQNNLRERTRGDDPLEFSLKIHPKRRQRFTVEFETV